MDSKDNDQEIVSLQDVLEEDQQLEDTANAVLGDSDDSQCTYGKGYVDRQALYACATCVTKGKEPAGFCLACSLHCHDGHQLYELYTKRNFRCGCGNSKFPGFSCTLLPDKDELNARNIYNHNFKGLYCTCNRPYPDAEDEVEDEMIQCIVCEDWFHSRHLGGKIPPSYQEMVCDSCMRTHSYLRYYQLHTTPVRVQTECPVEGEGIKITVEKADQTSSSTKRDENDSLKNPECGNSGSDPAPCGTNGLRVSQAAHTEASGGGEITTKKVFVSSSDSDQEATTPLCELARRRALVSECDGGTSSDFDGPGFFSEGWRKQLCTCPACKELYMHSCADQNTLCLLGESDTVASYEERAQARPSTHDAGMAALYSSMDRVQQVEVLHEYNDLKTELSDFLKGFAQGGKVVSKRDIDDFFQGMQARKKRRVETGNGVPPSNCHY